MKLSLKKLDGTPVEKLVEAPRYGGTLISAYFVMDTSWDDYFQGTHSTKNLQLTNNLLATGDWTRGSAGTEETTWWGSEWDSRFQAGSLAESWEIPDVETIILHIRKGVHWQDKPPMNGREFTVDDVVFNLNRILLNPKSKRGGRIGT